MKIRKWTFINVHFSKIQNRFEKTLHHSLIQRPPAAVCDHCIMLFFINSSVVTCRPLCCGFVNRRKNRIKGPKDWEAVLENSCWAIFGGCFEYLNFRVVAGFQKMVRNLEKPFCRILGWPIFGDVLNNTFRQFR